jgi:hypothetical protein
VLPNKFFLGATGIILAVALTVGVVSAGGSGQTDETPTPTPSSEASPTAEASPSPTAKPSPSPSAEASPTDSPEATDAPEDEEEVEGEGDAAGNQKIAGVIAAEFGSTPEEVLALHDQGIGFGALFKLYSIARAKGISVDQLLAEIEASGGGFAFGKLKKSLTDEERAILEAGPKNLGELVSGSNKGNDDGEDENPDAESSPQGSNSGGGGPPSHAKAKGHNKKN